MLLKVLSMTPLLAFVAFAVAEAVRPARALPHVRGHKLRGIAYLIALGALFNVLTALITPHLGGPVLPGARLGTVGGAIVAYLVIDLCMNLWHRLRHGPLWRIHQLHHASERMDVWGANAFHPLDVAPGVVLIAVVGQVVLGVTPMAAAVAGAFGGFMSMFTHANLRTPRWLGYFIARPESHAAHHRRGTKPVNFGTIPLWDMLLGTFENPARADFEAGFYDGASRRVVDMLLLRDATR